jgi:hypothetical protein
MKKLIFLGVFLGVGYAAYNHFRTPNAFIASRDSLGITLNFDGKLIPITNEQLKIGFGLVTGPFSIVVTKVNDFEFIKVLKNSKRVIERPLSTI